MRKKILKSLALATCVIALCSAMAGCKNSTGKTTKETVKTVYVYLPDGTLLDKGTPDRVSGYGYNTRVFVQMNGKTYKTSWANVVLVEE